MKDDNKIFLELLKKGKDKDLARYIREHPSYNTSGGMILVILAPFGNLALQVSLFLRLKVSPDDTSQEDMFSEKIGKGQL